MSIVYPTIIINFLLFILCLIAIWFYCYAIYAAIAFSQHPYPVDTEFHPPMTILKPICGLEAGTYENWASFCRQQYPAYQIIFSVRDNQDPAIPLVKQIINDFPQVDIQLIVSDRTIGTNLKISNLANAIQFVKYEFLIIADSDIRVTNDYLQQVIQPFQDKEIGVVTCLYRSSAQGWVTTLEAIGTATDFHAGVLVSNKLEGIKFAFGSTIVIRKQVLEEIGGLEAIADYLADDFQLGYLPSQAGYKVLLSNYVVEHVLTTTTLADSINRQIRWARCTRISRPWGYLGLIFTYGTITSLLLLITTGESIVGWTALFITWIMRLTMGWVVGVKILNDSAAKKYLWLIPLWDLIDFAIWCYCFVGNTIEWRGQQLRMTKQGKLVAIKT
ncbi:MAG: bacteriohopanetetrol glucosamine biosynthesis glycosyltransferase HpnI [Pelatocladus maniniholoensis HA4357-MV3]|uniref:Bacteriohopanetetrol glucosamine biosynthesis glycosyltransferase HpnI n=1 Tax=Pelatocladus maniniholoensis HA4357-MV3 TaxID=1117104 RepID=A0A9E3LVT7_9NOST|nr:bacteriohopanetetrol glucosamine biosynthesis glycosyltransferase HpnI [Pelatocladus maniniholoensis HA4357-MV3]BAZ66006.1 putative glycosyl transferase, group 2 family protein [Fischerella sp. NIES-4106]